MANVSGFEKKKEREAEEARDLNLLQSILGPGEFKVLMAFRELRAFSTLKVVMKQDGKRATIFVTHESQTAIDTPEEGV